ncbi:SGNH hydrolase-type esterase domain-containing protein [Mrakia frigida]|uniref:SGNH hydrolase-type esterase domain-containing protein n=1 Tax=Mrakia frigida TaxID=29902 RepID=UPI003FCC00FB
MRLLFLSLTFLGFASASSILQQRELENAVSFVLVGDSTTNNGTTVNSGGWSNGFCASLKPGTFCSNRASNGKTTGTIVDSGFYALALADIKQEARRSHFRSSTKNLTSPTFLLSKLQVKKHKTVFVTFSFGHNDMKIAPPESMGANLTRFIAETRSLGAYPVLITSVSRRSFVGETDVIKDTLGPWADETTRVGATTKTPVLPLLATSISYQESIGRVATWILNRSPTDFTHLNLSGQHLYGRMVADLFQLFALNYEGIPKVKSPFITDPPLSLALYSGKQYVFVAEYPPNNGTVLTSSTAVFSGSATLSATPSVSSV